MAYSVAHTIQAHAGAVHVARFNATGRYLLTGGSDQQIHLWNAKTGVGPQDELDSKGRSTCIQRYSGHSYEVLCLDVAPDSTRFASGGPDRAVMVWDVASGQTLRRFNAHTGRIHDVKFAGARDEGSLLYAAGSDTILRAYDLRAAGAWRPIFEATEATDAILALALTPGSVHTASVDGKLRTYDVRMGELRTDTLDEPITSLCPTQDGAAMLVSMLSSTHRLMDLTDGTQLQQFQGHTQTSFRCHATLSTDEALVLGGDETGALYAWDTLSGRKKWEGRPDYRGSVRFRRAPQTPVSILWTDVSPDEAEPDIVTASSCGTVHVWCR
ncbi:catalytic step 2 spliceosome protein [Malassezia pachydermatis]